MNVKKSFTVSFCIILVFVNSFIGCVKKEIVNEFNMDDLPYSTLTKAGDNSIHYLLTIPYEEAFKILTEKFGDPNFESMLYQNSSLSFDAPAGSAIFEIVTGQNASKRLVLSGAPVDSENNIWSGVTWKQ